MSPREHFFPSFRDEVGGIKPTARHPVPIWTASDIGTSDRFIPSRAVSNMNIDLWGSMKDREVNSYSDPVENNSNEPQSTSNTPDDSGTNASNGANTRTTEMLASQPNLHNVLLRSELLGENMNPYGNNFSLNGQLRIPGQAAPFRDGVNRLRFQSPRQAYHDNIFNELTGPTSVVNSFSLTPVGSSASQRLMSAPQKRRRRIAKVPFKVLDAPALQDDFYLNLVDWSSQNVLAVGLGSCVYLWSACTSKVTKLCDLAQTEDLVTSVSWAQRGTHLAVGTNRGEVQLWDSIKVKKIRTMTGHTARVGTLAWTGPTLASGGRDRLIYLRDVRVEKPYSSRLTAHKQEVCGLKWSFDEPSFLASGGNDNQLHVVDSRNPGSPLHRFSDHTAAVKAIAWSPHQHGLLASGGGTADRCIRFWNTLSGASLSTVDTGSQVCNLAWSQNCNEIVSTHGYSLNQIVVWRYPSLSKVVTLTGHTYRVLYLALSPDGSTIVTGAGDETLRFWQIFPGPRSDGKNNAGSLLFPNTLGSVIR
jgi:cell division cycle 20-like protein 1, cofactor of APC complex